MESHSEKAERDLIKPNCVSTAILSRERGAKVSCSLPLQQPRDFHLKVTLINTVHKSHPSPHPAVAIIGPVPGHIRPVNKCVHVCVCVCVYVCVCVCTCTRVSVQDGIQVGVCVQVRVPLHPDMSHLFLVVYMLTQSKLMESS